MKTTAPLLAGALTFISLVSGCETTSQGSKTYTRSQAQAPLQVFQCTVLRVEEVQIVAEETGGGATAGAVVGGIVGSTMGGGRGTRLATTAGAVGGAAVGSAAERARSTQAGLEIEVELDDGRLMVIVQAADDVYAVGDRIRIIQSGDGTMRVRQ